MKLHLWLVGSLVFLLSSCLGDDDDNDYPDWYLANCQISSFSLKNDSIPGLSDVKFTIDQVNGLIYNKDSMPYGTVIDEKVVCSITYEVGALSVEVYQDATGETAYWNGSDSLDFSGYVQFDVYSIDGRTSKRYIARLNVHQQHPDSMTWTQSNGLSSGKSLQDQKVIEYDNMYYMYVRNEDGYELYLSSNPTGWIQSSLTGLSDHTFILSQIINFEGYLYMPTTDGLLFYSANGHDWNALEESPDVKSIMGVVEKSSQLNRPSLLSAIIVENGVWHFAAMNKDLQWQTGDVISSNFPISGFASLSHEVMFYQRLMVVAGKDRNNQLSNAAWETMNGLQWVQLTDERDDFFDRREGVALAKYDEQFYFFGGIDASDKGRKDIYRSLNKGVTWEVVDTLIIFPDDYKGRGYSSIIVDDNQYIYLFGGKESNSANMLDELWSGRINRLGFKD